MSELSDYRRCVEAPMIADYEATIKSLRAERDEWRANATEFKELCSEWEARATALEKALEPFAWFGEKNTDSTGWAGLRCEGERINVWFGPSDFRNAFEASALSPKLGEEKR
jgi:hypothetical protein